MNRVEEYINSVYKNIQGNKDEVEDLKQEMRNHLLQTVEELKNEGKTEEESIKIAISRFGKCEQVENELSKVFKVQRKFLKMLLMISIASLVLAIVCYIGYKITDDMFELRTPESLKTAVEDKINEGKQISDEEVTKVLTKYKKQFTYVALYKENNYSKNPDNLYPLDFPIKEVLQDKNDKCFFTTYAKSPDGTNWTIVYGFDYAGFDKFIPISLHKVAQILFVAYWLLFSVWCVINGYYNNNLSLVWIILFFTLNIVGYIIYVLDKKNSLKLKYA